jgi:N-acetylneuraminic acid mutarotase
MLIGLLGTASLSLGAGDTWTQKADMPTARLGLTTAVVNGKIYAIGGYARANSPAMKTVEEYDPATDTWTTKADMPTQRWLLATSVVNGKVYAIGGGNVLDSGLPGLSTVEEYDAATNTWSAKADMPTPRLGLATCVVNGVIYAIGGFSGVTQPFRTVEAYDPLTDTWTRKADMPTARFFLSASVVDGKIYAIGGGFGSPSQVVASVEEYDPATDTWTSITTMAEPKFSIATSTLNGKIYAFGGRYGDQNFSTVEEYDPAADIWTRKTSMPRPRSALSASEVNGKIYAIGGAEMATGSHPGLRTVYEYDATPPLVVDFNGDGIVDSADMCIMVDDWHTDYPLCDIAPRPFGDGIVDVQDLIMLSEYLTKEVDDSTLAAHWALDETEGEIAYDSAGLHDAFVIGGALWQPSGGQVDGALEFDGVDDSVIAGPVLNAANPEISSGLSVFAWVQGGAPGQVVISGAAGAKLDAEGKLMTELTSPGRSAVPLLSDTTITDGQWHRIGFVWDGSNRIIYVDGVVVGDDTPLGLEGSQMGLYIGTGKAMEPGTYFSGLIDDVRIYSRAVKP